MEELSKHTKFIKFGVHLLPQIIKILHVLIIKQKIKKGKDPKEIENKRPGACVQNLPGVIPYLAVATEAVAPPPPGAEAVHPEPPRARIRLPRTSSLCSRTSRSRSRSASPTNLNPSYAAPPLEFRRRLAGATRRHCSIAWARSCASTSSTSLPSHASRGARSSSSSSIY